MTPFQKFKETTYQQMLGKYHARFMIECFYLDEESYTLMVNYTRGSELDISVDPEEYHDVYAFERELRDKQVIGHIPEKVSPILYTLIENHMDEFVYVSEKELSEYVMMNNITPRYVEQFIKEHALIREGHYIFLKECVEKIVFRGNYNIVYNIPYHPITNEIMEMCR